jgi:hypothetical protein
MAFLWLKGYQNLRQFLMQCNNQLAIGHHQLRLLLGNWSQRITCAQVQLPLWRMTPRDYSTVHTPDDLMDYLIL